MADTIVVFVLTRHWVLGASYDCPRQVPGAWSHHPHWRCGICCRSVAFDYPAANMSRNSAVFRWVVSHHHLSRRRHFSLCYSGWSYWTVEVATSTLLYYTFTMQSFVSSLPFTNSQL